MGKIYRTSMDSITTLLWLMMISLPIFLTTYGILSLDWIMIAMGMVLNTLGMLYIVWPMISSFYELDDEGLVVRYWGVSAYPYHEIKEVKKVSGCHKFALAGMGYYCTNFKSRVLVKTSKREFVISPDNPDEFVKELRERVKMITNVYRMTKQ